MAQRRLPLLCALFAMLATVHGDFLPTDDLPNMQFAGQIFVRNSTGQNVTGLLPLSSDATQGPSLDGHLALLTDSNFATIASGSIALISCDRYPGNLQAQDIFNGVQANENTTAVIFYSSTNNYCDTTSDELYEVPMYTTTSTSGASSIVQVSQNNDKAPAVQITRGNSDASMGGSGNPSDNQSNPLGPSPSTAVAMIILYSITGVITALFLVIIVTGAIRAHRHPDRYGPRDVMGRPRQSRARGLGRAILDTIPIVKFGEKEPPKPTDVELGSTNEARAASLEANVARASTGANVEHDASQTRDGNTTVMATNVATSEGNVRGNDGPEEAIAPAVAGGAAASTAGSEPPPEEALGCSICTDDFEKGQDIRVLPCDHKFHPECVDPWLLNVSGTCPLCRVDLRPVETNTSENFDSDSSNEPNHLAPPLQTSENDLSYRRRSNLRDILSFRTRPNASPAERIYALRRLREQRGQGSTDNVSQAGNTPRMSSRFSGMFGRGRGREESPQPQPQPPVNGGAEEPSQQQR